MIKFTTERALHSAIKEIYEESANQKEFERKVTDFASKGIYVMDVEEPYTAEELMEL